MFEKKVILVGLLVLVVLGASVVERQKESLHFSPPRGTSSFPPAGGPLGDHLDIDTSRPANRVVRLTKTLSNGIIVEHYALSTGFSIDMGGGNDDVDISCQGTGITITISLGPGLDNLDAKGNCKLVVNGGPDKDTIKTSDNHDVIKGDGGWDELRGRKGNDIIEGGEGNDVIHGGEGDDRINGQTGEDWIYGDNGNDVLYGGDQRDNIFGNVGNDIILGELGNDGMLDGATGDDIICGGEGDDTNIIGGDGKDILLGGAGNDILSDLDDNSCVEGGEGIDRGSILGTNILVEGQHPLGGIDNIKCLDLSSALAPQRCSQDYLNQGGVLCTLPNQEPALNKCLMTWQGETPTVD